MRKKVVVIAVVIVIAVVAMWAARFYWENLRGILPAISKPDQDIRELLDKTGAPLTLPNGFKISIFADNVPDARVLAFDDKKHLWVSQTKQGTISRLIIKNDQVTGHVIEFKNLNNPHGIAFDPANYSILYIAEEHRISKVNLSSRERELETIHTFPEGTGHYTRTIRFGPDQRLYISIGSSCNVCRENDSKRATILSMGKGGGGGDVNIFARGLRNAVFFVWHPLTEEMWATEMGRDLLGDDLPPDEINIVKAPLNGVPRFYGWPVCYGKNIHDIDFDKNTYIRNPCQEPFETPSYIDLPAHSAPLGLAFIPPSFSWQREYWYNLIVAYHGSWNRTAPTGYKLVRVKLNESGEYLGTEDFISGWLTSKNDVLGRPVDVLVEEDGTMFVSDDKAGVIYKITSNSIQ